MSLIPVTFFFFSHFLFFYNSRDVFAVTNRNLCHPKQRDALLEFKNKFNIKKPCFGCPGPPKTNSWGNSSDCCRWEGITCDAKSGEVIELDLMCSCLHGWFHSNSNLSMLQNFPFLTTLDLSYNHLSGQIPSSFGNLSQLTSLYLSGNYFSGLIPSSLGNLFHLTSLRLYGNNLVGEIPSSLGNLSYLTFLDLSTNNFVGEIPSSFGSLNQLSILRVDNNKLSGNLPLGLINLTMLSELSLFHNQFTGTLPPNLTSLSILESFSANGNNFVGTIPSSLFTLPFITLIFLENNQFSGTLEFGNISSPSNLLVLQLGGNNLRGPIPRSISRLVNLRTLDLSHFNIQGPVDFNILSHLKLLGNLYLSHSNTTTTIDLNAVLSTFKMLISLDLSGNHVLVTNKSSVPDHPSQLIVSLNLSRCGITEFPEVLRMQRQMRTLDISNNKIKGQVPSWLLLQLEYMYISNNNFIGFERSTKPEKSFASKPSMKHLLGSNNNFSGDIPSFICSLRSLIILDLSNNDFSGSIPRCMGKFMSTLSDLNLRRNRLSGSLPKNIIKSLRSLDVSHNELEGKLPRSLIHFSTLEVLNVERNRIKDTFPFWLSSLKKLHVLVLRSNAFHGRIHQTRFPKLRIMDISRNQFNGTLPSDCFVDWTAMSSLEKDEDRFNEKYLGSGYYHDSMVLTNKGVEMELVRILKIYTALDFSENKFEGEIPKSIGLLKELQVLNLSSNDFTGHIPSSMGNLRELESLDVSRNKLSGAIPQELGNLSYLAYMNFSHNQLGGLVPGGTQFRRQKCSSFEDNPGLYGPSLDEVCVDIHAPTPQEHEQPESEEEDEEMMFSWLAAAIGLGPGIAFGLMIGYILVCYKPQWFMNHFQRNKHRSRRRRSTTSLIKSKPKKTMKQPNRNQ
ncbi:PREDICTED: receptor-like protein 12 isoform X1 [Camelina sativa]|uniref:Receptor-like protein 12 isoform X1 n=1 Tax=Camelina sativa TaxID=90675 RepID=A0ABM0W0T8_CAMSA|nr:PREDICTED: receptor-like protein 12 isoform X1 [Camelina sativa]